MLEATANTDEIKSIFVCWGKKAIIFLEQITEIISPVKKNYKDSFNNFSIPSISSFKISEVISFFSSSLRYENFLQLFFCCVILVQKNNF